jgi:hypothetical protein
MLFINERMAFRLYSAYCLLGCHLPLSLVLCLVILTLQLVLKIILLFSTYMKNLLLQLHSLASTTIREVGNGTVPLSHLALMKQPKNWLILMQVCLFNFY